MKKKEKKCKQFYIGTYVLMLDGACANRQPSARFLVTRSKQKLSTTLQILFIQSSFHFYVTIFSCKSSKCVSLTVCLAVASRRFSRFIPSNQHNAIQKLNIYCHLSLCVRVNTDDWDHAIDLDEKSSEKKNRFTLP